MKPFLQDIAEYILAKPGSDLEKLSLILPNKRACTYLRKHISTLLDKPAFSPEFLTMDQWGEQNTSEEIPDQISLLFLLYQTYVEVKGPGAEPFANFTKWGGMMLNDFDEIDKYLVDPKVIFSDLRNIMEIENWSFGTEEELSDQQQIFMDFWNELPKYYTAFEKRLGQSSKIYRGKAYRNLARRIESFTTERFYYFIGFNHLSRAEESIVLSLTKDKKAEFLPDADTFFLENAEHEAGHFLRNIHEKVWKPDKLGDFFRTIPKNFRQIETTGQIAQTKVAGTVIEQFFRDDPKMEKTALVLADETLFVPMLGSLPNCLVEANITMGYPLRYSPMQRMIESVFRIQDELAKNSGNRIHHSAILNFLDHPFIPKDDQFVENLKHFGKLLAEKNKVYVHVKEIFEKFESFSVISEVFTLWKSPVTDGVDAFNQLIHFIESSVTRTSDPANYEILMHFRDCVLRFQRISTGFQFPVEFKTFKQLFSLSWQYESLSFPGNPLEGLQVMGLLETRAIDFDRIVIVGANEGILPPSGNIQSFIPWDLRKKSGLPTVETKQAEFAYYFYRLISRAREVVFTYNSFADGWISGEKSRYLLQLPREIPEDAGHTFSQVVYVPPATATRTESTSYLINPLILSELDNHLVNKGLSPSGFNKLITCPLDFYYTYVLKIKEASSVEENFESSTFGSKIHKVLEELFKPYLETKSPLDAQTLTKKKQDIHQLLFDAYTTKEEDDYASVFDKTELETGYNKLAFDMSLNYIRQFIDRQIEEIKSSQYPIYIVELEKELKMTVKWNFDGEVKEFTLNGKVDRIDKIGEHYRIIDYKSGACSEEKVQLPQNISNPDVMAKFIHDPDKGYARQLLFYSFLFQNQPEQYKSFSAGIISLVKMKDWMQPVHVKNAGTAKLDSTVLNLFAEELENSVAEIYSEGYTFRHNPESKYCENC